MKKIALFLFVTLLPVALQAQGPQAHDNARAVKPVVIKGHITNNTSKTWGLMTCDLLSQNRLDVKIDKEGNFTYTFNTTGLAEVIFAMDSVPHMQFAVPGDTLLVNWDAKNITASLQVTGANAERTKEAALMQKLDAYLMPYINMQRGFGGYNEGNDSLKAVKINAMYNDIMFDVLSAPRTAHTEKIVADLYYRFLGTMKSYGGRLKYPLAFTRSAGMVEGWEKLVPGFDAYKSLNYTHFKWSKECRDFMFDYVRFDAKRTFDDGINLVYDNGTAPLPFEPGYNDYIKAMYSTGFTMVRDWLAMTAIKFSYQHYTFAESERAYADFMLAVQVPVIRDSLIAYHKRVIKLTPGKPAPDFLLKDASGKMVSLKSLRGKVIYLDFWGVNCGPCIYDIENKVPALHAKYKGKNVLFVNVCVDSNEQEWKKSLKELKLDGINLIAEGWTKHPVCQAYGVNGIPHYVLIDEYGIIIDNNAPRAAEENEIAAALDKALGNLK
ncbi:TlpA disulfide reductase family protein [uncultured Chitinophaga sp.]|uniref:TlpA family protein disulfide reductase n=1 Tax=uncultured Chitinophaga sp. TaxID=339340 RepID=UPI0025EB3B7A|nr:TlpA disulfide reductase family protein [uncultured Chitinophaga sp.]